MCYSLEASITAGLGLGLAGYGMVAKALRHDRRMLLFAAFPLVFSAHQFVEAAVWLTRNDPVAGQPYRYLYTLIAFAMWPVLTPAAAAYAESDPERNRLWWTMGGVGIVLAAYLIAKLAGADGIDLSVYRHSLAYDPLFRAPAARDGLSLSGTDGVAAHLQRAKGDQGFRRRGVRDVCHGARSKSAGLVFGLVSRCGGVQPGHCACDRRRAQL